MPRSKPATIDAFGRIHLPKRLRDAAGLQVGTEVEIREEPSGLRLVPRAGGVLLKRVRGLLIVSGEADGDIAGAVERFRRARHRRVAGRRK
jgi:bifunctional DNA-binding transcriptional regulator/antitoxin component of YhaV-PrlF toxin-antitoxin module